MWCLANFKEEKDIIKTMTTNIANEFTDRIIVDWLYQAMWHMWMQEWNLGWNVLDTISDT